MGSHIVDALRAAGQDVRVLDVRTGGDIRDADAVERALDGVDHVCHQAGMVGLGVDFLDVADYVSHNDLGTAVLLRALARRRFRGRLVLASSMVVYGEGHYRCATHGPVRPQPRRAADLDAGRFEPRCPRCGRGAGAGGDRRGRAGRPAQRVRGDEAPPGASRLRLRARDRGAGHRAALPQRLRAADAARHPVRRRRGDLRRRARRRARAAGLRGRRPAARLRPRARRRARQPRWRCWRPSRRRAPSTSARARRAASARWPTRCAPRTATAAPPVEVTGEYRLGDVRHVFASAALAADELGFIAQEDFATGMAELADEHRMNPARETASAQRATATLGP